MEAKSRSAFKILIGKPIEKRRVGRTTRRWEDTIRVDYKEMGVSKRCWIWIIGKPLQISIEPPSSINHGVN